MEGSESAHDGEELEKGRGDVDGDEGEDGPCTPGYFVGPLISLKEQLEKDKDDESLRRWKEKLLGHIDENLNGEIEPRIIFHSISVISEGCGEHTMSLSAENQGDVLFALREGTPCSFKLNFSVQNNIVCGLAYSNKIWKGGIQGKQDVACVDQNRGMLGTFAPQRDPYTQILDEETTPSGFLARGTYTAELKFVDDDKRCHLKIKYTFEIKKH